ncbi:MAG: acyl-CoA dehydrogenase [Bacteroidota bacterium]
MRPDENGNLVPNDVTTAGLFHKMGQVGYATAHLLMGDKGDCRGYLVGKPHQGLRYMFQMMNAARISVGVGGAAIASAAYYASLRYALERSQGRRMGSSESKSLIIHHADVRRMLFLQKAVVEGSLSLVMECAKLEDLVKVTEGEEKMKHHLLLELLTPIVKTFPTEYGIYAVSNGLQVLGGYGFLKDYALEQLYRDIRITAIYEGTTGIQSLDLLGRKVMMNEGQAVKLLAENIQGTIGQAMAFDSLKPYAEQLGKELARVNDVMQHLIGVAMSGDQERFASDANLFMEMFSLNVIAWQWLKQGVVAAGKLANDAPTGDELTFLESKLRTLQYFFAYELVKTKGLATRLKDERVITIADSERELLV